MEHGGASKRTASRENEHEHNVQHRTSNEKKKINHKDTIVAYHCEKVQNRRSNLFKKHVDFTGYCNEIAAPFRLAP